jgi:hydroxyacylglutathione hydrolase
MRAIRLPLGPIQTNCYLVSRESQGDALVVDPGEEASRLLAELAARGLEPCAILITHGHFDHLGAVGPVARQTGCPVYIPRREADSLAHLAERAPEGFGPFESYAADHLLDGGEHLSLAGLKIDVLSVPGHSPGHLAYLIEGTLFSGDVLFAGSVGRTDFADADWETLAASLRMLVDTLPPETPVLSGHGPETTLAAELAGNPFLAQAGAAHGRARR